MKETKINKYKDSLYSRKYKDNTEEDLERLKKLRKKNIDIKKDWGGVEDDLNQKTELYKLESRKPNYFLIFFILSLVFFVISASIAGFYLYFQKNEIPLNQIGVSLVSPNNIDSGNILEYSIKLENNTDSNFKNITLYLSYPEGSLDPDDNYPKENEEIELKDILAGGSEIIKKKIILSGAPGEKKKIKFNLSYQMDGYSTLFEKKKEFFVKIDSAPIFVKINTPEYVTSNKEFSIDIEVSSNGKNEQKNLVLIGRYPNGFEITSFDPNPIFKTSHKNIFRIDKLKIGEKKEIHLKAKMTGENGEMKVLSFVSGIGSQDTNEIELKYFESKEKIFIKKPGLDLKLFCNNKEIEDIIPISATSLSCKYKLTNNLKNKITDIKVRLDYNDFVLEEDEIKAKNAYIDSNKNQIYWDKNETKEMTVINSNESVDIPLKFKIKSPLKLAGEKREPNIPLTFLVRATNYDNGNKLGFVDRKIEKLIKLNSYIKLISNTNYNNGPLINYGGPKPKIGQEVSYTINWEVFNSTNKLKNVEIIGKLPVGVEWKNIYSPSDSYIKYNPDTRIIKWSIKNISPFIGYRTDPKKISFQVSFTPVLAELGDFKDLVTDIKMTAIDTYTNQTLETKSDNASTRLDSSEKLEYATGRVSR